MKSKRKNPLPEFDTPAISRSENMAHIKAKNSKTTETILRMGLIRNGVSGWRLHPSLFGSPDFYFVKKKLAVFVDGCFWHSCPRCGHIPKTNPLYWKAKLSRNKSRDRLVSTTLKKEGIYVIRFWEHSLKEQTGVTTAIKKLTRLVNNN